MIKPIRMERLAYKTIGLETIILDSKIGREVHQLNEVASFVWNLCDGEHDLQKIIELVCNEFEVDPMAATEDVRNLITEFNSKHLILENSP